jgi:hypothetical protein
MKYEYAISQGKGTLLDHGVCDGSINFAGSAIRFAFNVVNQAKIEHQAMPDQKVLMKNGCTLIIAPCDDDCETGQ